MTKCIFCDVESEFVKGAAIGNKNKGVCGKCMEWLSYYIRRQEIIEKEEIELRAKGIEPAERL